MKKLWRDLFIVGGIFLIWRSVFVGIEKLAPLFWNLREGFLGQLTPWANFDGAHYTSIAKNGYGVYQYAFFPLYPWLIHWLSFFLKLPYEHAAVLVSLGAFFIGLFLFWRYLEGSRGRIWTIAFLLLYPTSFFFAAAYSESLFFALTSGALLAVKRKRWFLGGSLVAFASATRLVGFFLIFPLLFAKRWTATVLAPLGLLMYMAYLWVTAGDPLAFFHVQPAFGAGRSGGELVFLPQVLWRYVRIFLTVDPQTYLYNVAVFELSAFALGVTLVFVAWKKRYKPGILLYSACALLLPTLTGTFSSVPRYTLALFPLFTVFGTTRSVGVKIVLLVVFFTALVYAATAFLRGHFIS